MGSGNGLASNLKISKDINTALQVITSNHITTIDVGLMNDKYFFSNMGLGIDAKVIDRYTSQKKRNFSGYCQATIWSFLNFKPIPLDIKVDGKTLNNKSYFFVLCSNSNEAGYGISFNPEAKLDDQKLDVLCVEQLNIFEMIVFGFSVLLNRIHKMKKAFIFQGEEIIFTSKNHSILAQIDGEALQINTNKAVVTILPHALQVITPSIK